MQILFLWHFIPFKSLWFCLEMQNPHLTVKTTTTTTKTCFLTVNNVPVLGHKVVVVPNSFCSFQDIPFLFHNVLSSCGTETVHWGFFRSKSGLSCTSCAIQYTERDFRSHVLRFLPKINRLSSEGSLQRLPNYYLWFDVRGSQPHTGQKSCHLERNYNRQGSIEKIVSRRKTFSKTRTQSGYQFSMILFDESDLRVGKLQDSSYIPESLTSNSFFGWTWEFWNRQGLFHCYIAY